jgi:hypothetical protein
MGREIGAPRTGETHHHATFNPRICGGDASSCGIQPKDLGEEGTHHDLDVVHGTGAPSHVEFGHGARVSNLFPVSRRSVVEHRNLTVAEPKQRGTIVVVPHHGDSAHVGEVHQTHGEYGP